jgi:predicted MFS family arabinose efflux permease
VLFVNVPVAILAILGAQRFVPESRDERAQGFDIPGAVFITAGLMTLVYGLVNANSYGWASAKTIAALLGSFVLVGVFVEVQLRAGNPLVPFRLFKSRTLLGADLGSLLVGAGIFPMFFFLILWMQQINGYTPVKSGLAFLPMTFIIGISAGIGAQLLGRLGARPLLFAGPILAALGLVSLGLRLNPDSSYLGTVVPSLALVALGMGLTFVSLTSSAVAGVPQEDAGIASALLNAGQQVGGALGLAILTAVSVGRTSHLAPQGAPRDPQQLPAYFSALVDGWGLALVIGSAFLLVAGLLALALVRVSKEAAAAALKEAGAAAA